MLRNPTYFLIIVAYSFVACTVGNSKNGQVNISTDKATEKVQTKPIIKRITETGYGGVDKFGEIQKRDMKLTSITYYNEKGKMVEYNNTDLKSNQKTKVVYKYDDNGNSISYDSFDSNGNLESRGIYKNDEKGYIIEVNVYNSNGDLNTKTKCRNDLRGNQIESDQYKSDGSLKNKVISKFDEKNQEIQYYIYDGKGNLVSPMNYEYKKYDFNGNWLLKIEESYGVYYVYEREIEYY